MTAVEQRCVLVKPGDVLLVGNLGDMSNLDPEVVGRFAAALGVAVATFESDITLDAAPVESLTVPAMPDRRCFGDCAERHTYAEPREATVSSSPGLPIYMRCGTSADESLVGWLARPGGMPDLLREVAKAWEEMQ